MTRSGLLSILGMLSAFLCMESTAQSFTFVPDDTVLSAPLGSEIVFNCTITNTSSLTLTLALVRTTNDLPPGWESSMCLDVCYPGSTDSILTSPQFGSTPLNPGESRPFSVHVYTATNQGTATVRITTRDTRNPTDQRIVTFTASSIEAGIADRDPKPQVFSLSECFPNPFNPGTTIRYSLPSESIVTLKVYNVLGQEVATLAHGMEQAGVLNARWDGKDALGLQLPGGVYFCRMDARLVGSNGLFTDVRKLLLLK